MVSLEGDNNSNIYYLSASEFCTDKRGRHWQEDDCIFRLHCSFTLLQEICCSVSPFQGHTNPSWYHCIHRYKQKLEHFDQTWPSKLANWPLDSNLQKFRYNTVEIFKHCISMATDRIARDHRQINCSRRQSFFCCHAIFVVDI